MTISFGRAVLLCAVLLAGCSTSPAPAAPAVSAAPAAAPVAFSGATVAPGAAVVLRFEDGTATATLADSPEARQFAAMLPVTVDFEDVWAQAKSGRLPHPITAAGTTPIHDPTPGDLYFWPTTEVLALYYADLGQAVPAPGLIRLGAVTAGLDALTADDHDVTIGLAA